MSVPRDIRRRLHSLGCEIDWLDTRPRSFCISLLQGSTQEIENLIMELITDYKCEQIARGEYDGIEEVVLSL